MAYCRKCGNELQDGVRFCPKCGASTEENQAEGQNTSPHNASVKPAYQDRKPAKDGHGQALGSLLCGIIGLVLCFFGYSCIVSVILGIVGIVLSGNARKNGNEEAIRTAGFVLSLLALILGAVITLYFIIALAFLGAAYDGMLRILQ